MKKTHWLRNTILILLVCAVAGSVLSAVNFRKENSRVYVSSAIQFTFDGAAEGKAPNGYAFDPAAGITSEAVLSEALKAADLDSRYTAEQIKPCLSVQGVYPDDFLEQIQRYDSLLDFSANRQQTLSGYYPTVYSVVLYSDFDPAISRAQLESLLKNALECYKALFARTNIYGLVSAAEFEGLETYDYFQQVDLIQNGLNALAAYADEMNELDASLQAGGNSFNDMAEKFRSLINNDLSRLNARITMNVLSKDSSRLETQYKYKIQELKNELTAQRQRQSRLDEEIKSYGKSGIIYLSTAETVEKVDTQSPVYYDQLVSQRGTVSDKIASLLGDLTTYEKRLAELQRAMEATGEQSADAEGENSTTYSQDRAAAAKERQIASLETGFTRLYAKIAEAVDEFNALLTAYNGQEVNDGTVIVTKIRYEAPSFLSGAFVKKLLKTAGPICAVGFMLAMVLIIISRRREEKRA